MFLVDFITNHINGVVETGKVIVVADSHALAIDIVATHLNLPPSRTRFDTEKKKPPFFSVENHQHYPTKRPVIRTEIGDSTAPQHYQILVQASNVLGRSEQQAIRKLGEELQARGSQTRLRHNLELLIECTTADKQRSTPINALEKIEMYGARSAKRAVQGGRAQGR
jgi:hypothetical protein